MRGSTLTRGKQIAAACLLCIMLAVGVAFVLAPRGDIVTQIKIGASPARVWAALTEASKYPAWQPDIRLLGRLAPGQVIEVQEGQGSDTMVFHPVVLVARPGEEVRWRGHVWRPGVFDAVHYFRLAAEAGGTRLTQGEAAHGVALWFFDLRRLVPSFDLVNAQLKKRAEEKLW